jgi:hypothetical protein
MQEALRSLFPDLPGLLLQKTELLFRGVRFSEALALAAERGAAPGFWPYRKTDARGSAQMIPVPYLFSLPGGAVARVRVDDASDLWVRGDPEVGFELCEGDEALTPIGFVMRHAWQESFTTDGVKPFAAGVAQLGDMIVVNAAPGCEYFRAKDAQGESLRCRYCGYGRFDKRSQALGQVPGEPALSADVYRRLGEIMRIAAEVPEVSHVYLTGGSMLSPEAEAARYLPIIETVRRAVGTRMRVTAGSGAVLPEDSRRFRDAGADSCCYNLEVWDAATFAACCPGKSQAVGREGWIESLLGAVEVFGWGDVGSAFVAGLELRPPGPSMSEEQMLASIVEGASFMLDHGVVPLYSPLWPVEGTAYAEHDGISAEAFLRLQRALHELRVARAFPIPAWIICPKCSYMLLEVDFDSALGVPATAERRAREAVP